MATCEQQVTGNLEKVEKRFPEDTSVRSSYLQELRAILDPPKAIEALSPAVPYELGVPLSWNSGAFGQLYPVYVRGLSYLASHQGAEAAAEFQKILDHRGIVASDPIGALAHLQLGRAYALSRDKTRARAGYQDFLTLCREADPDILQGSQGGVRQSAMSVGRRAHKFLQPAPASQPPVSCCNRLRSLSSRSWLI
jgi:hypothetical protein